ncbi:MAG: hypothetical protein SGJ00_11355 [bacterium]|nr:hypothetical protein [bacterium]
MKKLEHAILNLRGPKNAQQSFIDFVYISTYIQTWNHPKDVIEIISKNFSTNDLSFTIPLMYEELATEMVITAFSKNGNDLLGNLYERLFQNTEENTMLTWQQCKDLIKVPLELHKLDATFNFLDIGCRTGRILLASTLESKEKILYIGVEYSLIFIQITALNLLLTGFKNSEVILVDPKTHKFIGCYKIRPSKHKNLEWVSDVNFVKGWSGYHQYVTVKKLMR